MSRQIDQKIVGYSVVKPGDNQPAAPVEEAPQRTVMSELIERPELLVGHTYKISKSPASDHALYVTINDIVLDAGTEHESRRPFEIFINSKNMDQFQWIVALTRILSAVFRKGGDIKFLVEEMKAVFDPHGGYFRPGGGGYVPSLIAEIGQIIERHLKDIGLIEAPEMDAATKQMIAEKKAALGLSVTPSVAAAVTPTAAPTVTQAGDDASFPPTATMCSKCNNKSVVIMDGCATCLNCGHSKCG